MFKGSIKKSSSNSSEPKSSNKHLEATLDVKLVNKVNLKNENVEIEESMTDPFEEIPTIASSKSTSNARKRTISLRADEESIVSLAISKSQNNTPTTKNVLLCAGTSKGSIVVWSIMIDYNNTRNKLKIEKMHEFKEAHGKQDVDDLQVNSSLTNKGKAESEPHHVLLSIGRDNKCVIWSLKSFKKLTEINYLPTLNNDSNLRMKHARFSTFSNYLFTTFIPRVRGGGRDMSSYIERWSFNSTESTFSYKLESKHRIKNTILTTVQCSKDGHFVCVGDYEGRIELFDLNFNKVINFKKQHSSVITDLIFYHDFINNNTKYDDRNKLILTISIDRTLQCYKYINDARVEKEKFSIINRFDICSIHTFKLFLIAILFILLFCYFFTFIE